MKIHIPEQVLDLTEEGLKRVRFEVVVKEAVEAVAESPEAPVEAPAEVAPSEEVPAPEPVVNPAQ